MFDLTKKHPVFDEVLFCGLLVRGKILIRPFYLK